MSELQLGIPGFEYRDLYNPTKLAELHQQFLTGVTNADPALAERWKKYADVQGANYNPVDISTLLVDMAPHVGVFVAELFGVGASRELQQELAAREKVIFQFKRDFLERRSLKKHKSFESCLTVASREELLVFADEFEKHFTDHFAKADRELATAQATSELVEAEKAGKHKLGENDVLKLEALCAARHYDREFHKQVEGWASYHLPKEMHYDKLVEIIRPDELLTEKFIGPEEYYRQRDGFALTDERMTKREVQGETEYCIFCHERSKDSCSKGFKEKDGSFKKNPLGITLAGCPLDEKISEMHLLLSRGDAIASLALIMIDNPMCPGTGHRICNDCMKGCIYQKQTPVNIPQAETGALTNVLEMPWGVEIYGFLTRWNPLNVQRPVTLPYNGKNVLVVGLGPAGYTLSHYLLNEGFGVAGIDGLKIEPLDRDLTGYLNDSGEWIYPHPVEEWSDLYKRLDERSMDGFGGVAEYGITVRWDKNFLTLIYLTLARRATFAIYGGVRFGGTVTIEDAFDRYQFDHIAIATGAGKPTIVPMKNNLIRGIRKASDFLMALQLTGAAKKNTLANLQVQLPAVVIGGGLTAIDTATELAAYYPIQVEKMYDRYKAVIAKIGEEAFMKRLDTEERGIFAAMLAHGKEVKAERERAKQAGEKPNFIPLVRKWGGVTIAYRRSLNDSPAYRLNHEEVEKSLEEGIYYVELMSPVEALPDEFGAVRGIVFERQKEVEGKLRGSGELVEFPAKSVFVAAGTSPNTIYEKEQPGTFKKDTKNYFFQSFSLNGSLTLKESDNGFFTSHSHNGKYITYYGDNHPRYAGNVVKAMASARDGYPHVVHAVFGNETARKQLSDNMWFKFRSRLDEDLRATVVRVDRLTKTIVEVIVKAPAAARHFHPGQFYRLQNFEKLARSIDSTLLTMEGVALTGAWVDKEKGLLSLIVLEMGVSSRLCAALKPGEPVVVMGPTGTPTEIPENETVLLAGGGLGNAVLFSIAKALKEKGNRVLYFAGYKNGEDLFKREEIEASTDQVIWSTDAGAFIEHKREQDRHFRGNIIQAMMAYHNGETGATRLFPLAEVNRIIAIGSDRMMAAVKQARREGGVLHDLLNPQHVGIGSINSSMQCMMKEVCAQCLQKHVDPVTQQETGFVFSCFNQDQHLDEVDFKNLNERLKMNSLLEKLSLAYFETLLAKEPVPMV